MDSPNQAQSQVLPSPARWGRVLLVLGTLVLAGCAIAFGLGLGRMLTGDDWIILVTAIGFATYLVIAVIDIRHAFLLWIVTAPFARFIPLELELGQRIPNLTLNRLMTAILVLLLLAQVTTGRRKLVRFQWPDLFLLVFLVAIFLSVPSATGSLSAAVQLFLDQLLIPAMIYFLAKNLTTNRRELRETLVAMMIVGLYFSLLATREQLTGDVWFYPEDRSVLYSANVRRVVGLLGNPAFISLTINMSMPWTLYLFAGMRRLRLLRGLIILALFAGVYFCMNRSGWLTLVAVIVTMAALGKAFRRFLVLILVVLAMVAVVYSALLIASPAVQERLTAEGPIQYRLETWQIAWRMIQDHPWFGVGWENFALYYRRYGQWSVYLRATPSPHNNFLWVLLTGGLAALVPFLAFWLAVIGRGLSVYLRAMVEGDPQNRRNLAATYLACLAGVLVPAVTTDTLSGPYNNMIMFLFIGAFLGTVSTEITRSGLGSVARQRPPAIKRV